MGFFLKLFHPCETLCKGGFFFFLGPLALRLDGGAQATWLGKFSTQRAHAAQEKKRRKTTSHPPKDSLPTQEEKGARWGKLGGRIKKKKHTHTHTRLLPPACMLLELAKSSVLPAGEKSRQRSKKKEQRQINPRPGKVFLVFV